MKTRTHKEKRGERRKESRLNFEGTISGEMRHKSEVLAFEAFDVSKSGLGLYLSPCPPEGEEIELHLNLNLMSHAETKLRLTVRHIYGEDYFGKTRCGVELHASDQSRYDLIELVTRYLTLDSGLPLQRSSGF